MFTQTYPDGVLEEMEARYRNLQKLGTTHENAMRLANSSNPYNKRSPLQRKVGKGRFREF